MTEHLSEMILNAKLHGRADPRRRAYPFSQDIASTNAILFNYSYTKRQRIAAYRKWLETNQPCAFGRAAAKKNVFVCLLEEHDIISMKRGDDDLRDTIQDYRHLWKRYALEGLSSSFVIVLVSRSLVENDPRDGLKEICRRLLELYMEVDRIDDDAILEQREYVFLRHRDKDGETRLLKFATLPNIFCAQGDGRWWRDHRTPGGVMITSNALGHFTYIGTQEPDLQDKDKIKALEKAMLTIKNAYQGKKGVKSLRLCPATRLVAISENEATPLKDNSPQRGYSPDHYEGYFNTDHLIPSVFFNEETDPARVKLWDNLSFRYIFDPAADPQGHRDLMAGAEANWYEVRANMNRLPPFADPEKVSNLTPKLQGRLSDWLEKRLRSRLD
jgi:hypothetical protein